MLRLIKNIKDFDLASEITSGKKDINNMSSEEQNQLHEMIANYPHPQDNMVTVSKKALSPLVEAFRFDERHPYWLSKNTPFDSDIWELNLTPKVPKIIDFRVKLDDGESLTTKKHRPLLNSFKYWIISQGNPAYNSGKILTLTSICSNILRILTLIDSLLINAKKINLSKLHLAAVDKNFILDILTTIANHGYQDGIYNYKSKVYKYLANNINNISDDELLDFEKKFPFIASRHCTSEDSTFPFSDIDRKKACCYLYKQGAYSIGSSISSSNPRSTYFKKLYKNTLSASSTGFYKIDDLLIKKPLSNKEFVSIPVKNVESKGYSNAVITRYLSSFRSLITVNYNANAARISTHEFKDISISRIRRHAKLHDIGRFTTLPAPLVFEAMKNAFDFSFKYADDILETAFNCLLKKPKNKDNRGQVNTIAFKNESFKCYLPKSLKKLGVESWGVLDSDPNCFIKRRKNIGFVDLFNVLMGSIQIIVGATMARRQAELMDLDPICNLVPQGINPQENRRQEFELIFDNRKSGSGGQFATRESLSKPILNSVAGLIYKLQMFNERLIKAKINKSAELSLFVNLNPHHIAITSVNETTYNQHLNAFCDYFETSVIEYEINDYRRYYIRQHQLRRFFAMVFFYSKSFDGLDTLRHFLGHTDVEHLYYYITEGVAGEVLAGVKAKVLLDSTDENHIKNIKKLEPILKTHFQTKSLRIKTLPDAIETYGYKEEFLTSPTIETLKHTIDRERLITELIDEGIIDLRPEFFTIKAIDGTEKRDFNLVLHVTDLEEW